MKKTNKSFFRVFVTTFATSLLLFSYSATAKEFKLRLHHFMSQKGVSHSKILLPFVKRVEEASEGRLAIELYASMSLGGRPGDLYDQAVDGAVDIILTLPGYTSGRFNQTEVFELPFMMEDPVATSKAFWNYIASDLQKTEYEEAKILSGWVHGPGVIHSKKPIKRLKDMSGLEFRGPTRVITNFLGEIGASPVGMPLPKIPENLSKGVISGTLLPWEITPAIRLTELIKNHTELSGKKALYTATFILAMNWDAYYNLPKDLRKILDQESGEKFSQLAVSAMLEADIYGRKKAISEKNNLILLDKNEVEKWMDASQPVYKNWVKRAKTKGFNGQATIDKARQLIAKNK